MTEVRREGFSLMEVILAMSILLGGVVVLGRLASIGAKHARDAEDLAAAQLLCEARVTEILAGIVPAETIEAEPLADNPQWLISQELLPLDQPGVAALSVTVSRAPDDVPSSTITPAKEEKDVSVTFVRWILDAGVAPFRSMDSASPGFPASTEATIP